MTFGAGVLVTYVHMYVYVEALTREAQRKISHGLCVVLTQLTLKKKTSLVTVAQR